MNVAVVVNPVAGGGRMRSAWPAVKAALEAHFGDLSVGETRAPGDAAALARKFAGEGADLVISAGGDGTVSETVDGLLMGRNDGMRLPALGIFPIGTSSDLARGLGIAGDVAAIAARIAQSGGRRLDAGCVSYVDDHGALHSRHFINIASLGLSGPTDRAVNAAKSGGRMSGKAVFLFHTVREMIRYRFQDVRVTVDDQPPMEARIALVACANGRYFGGGMMIAPDAATDDGQLDVVIVRGTSKLSLLADLRLVYAGAHGGRPFCTILRGRKVVVEPVGDAIANGALLDIDGESPGRIPATFELLPGAIMVRC